MTAAGFKVEVLADSSGRWAGNELVFRTRDEAERYAADLMDRWTAVRDWRVVETEDLPTVRVDAGGRRIRLNRS
jgi:hypothetical protein